MNRGLAVLMALTLAGCTQGAEISDSPAAPATGQPSNNSPTATRDATDAAPQWSGPVRADAALPVIPRRKARGWTDPRDAAFDGIDLRRVAGRGREYNGVAVIDGQNISSFSAGGWGFRLAARPPRVEALAATQRIIDYGVVIDADGDRDPDCQIGINNDARQHGGFPVFRVWITNLRTGTTVEQVGPPYGGLVEFGHPSERGSRRWAGLAFLGGQPTHCLRFTPSSTFYAYSSLTEEGEVTAWDFAPDRAWLPMDCSQACRKAQ
jgi:hypothetical protein